MICLCKWKATEIRGPLISKTAQKAHSEARTPLPKPAFLQHHSPTSPSSSSVSTCVLPKLLLPDLFLFSWNFISNLHQWFCWSPLSSTLEATCLPFSLYQHQSPLSIHACVWNPSLIKNNVCLRNSLSMSSYSHHDHWNLIGNWSISRILLKLLHSCIIPPIQFRYCCTNMCAQGRKWTA